MRILLQIVALALAFLAGNIVHSMWTPKIADVQPNANTSRSFLRKGSTGTGAGSESALREADIAAPNGNNRVLQLPTDVVDALLAGGGQSSKISGRRLSRMGLSDEQIESVSAIKAESIAEFQGIEKTHAKLVSDEGGDYIVVAPFPGERQRWLEGVEADLREMIDDDRASVIARMIAFSDNDEDIGLYRREISVIETESENEAQKVRIEERTFDHNGQHIDSDYDLVGQQSRGRWGHLLQLGETENN